jgi:hypothetical protein
MSANGVPEAYQSPEGLRTLANYLRSQNGVKVRSGIEHEKRVDYFKGIIFSVLSIISTFMPSNIT